MFFGSVCVFSRCFGFVEVLSVCFEVLSASSLLFTFGLPEMVRDKLMPSVSLSCGDLCVRNTKGEVPLAARSLVKLYLPWTWLFWKP